MDLSSNLIESQKHKGAGGWKASLAALGVHGLIIGFIIFMTATTAHKITAEEKPMRAFLVGSAAPPPPPPPPPPAGASHPTPQPQVVQQPVQIPQFHQPTEVPKEIPKVETPVTSTADATPAPSSEPAGEAGGQPGGVAGGVAGGVEGGVVGGQVGGQVGGTLGGTPGGQIGGQVGGTGTTTEAPPPPPPPAPDPVPDGPVHVGGDVKAPIVIKRVEPQYTDLARKAHETGIVIVEAIINKQGEVEQVKVVKGLPMGLSEKAEEAVKQWHFKPGMMNGVPVEVIFDLTVNFTLN